MDIKNNIKPISYIKANAAEVLKQVNETRSPIVITQNGESKAVLMDAGSYQEMMDAMAMLKIIAMGEKDIAEGRVLTHEEVGKKLKEQLDAL
ncbi:type II toxin-antitoxin system Phd/YefM family antitoxin [Seleniivibrio sp.]|jgi:prevent-host-death family protein|uniref:type II toxin-antitoxin system Phd/YefM family antitoxin n=1 Tax=Seleniivibrio sp. TaxID=2898801 RepID=UPI0025DCA1F8|nr:type II toxin-antitoxin system Phd/YefM family antitoxin [Seleniivibrio sp.]MCD8553770.1 type II toxin-antitoxin system Phd/YefM family antitoxin [Seleniivibrio sp.]